MRLDCCSSMLLAGPQLNRSSFSTPARCPAPTPPPPRLPACSVDLGRFASADEAARVHDRAVLLASGFQAATNFPLADAYATAGTVLRGQLPAPEAQPGGAQQQGAQAYKGVVLRNGSWLALLDIGEL